MSTVYAGPFTPDAWRDVIWAIVNIFESGRPEGDPQAFQNYDDGVISYGKHQATLSSGVLERVLRQYFENSQTPVSQALQAEFGERIQRRDPQLRHNERLRQLLIEAGSEPAMVAAQDAIFERDFYRPAVDYAQQLGLSAPLSLAGLYDTRVQGGLTLLIKETNAALGGSGVGRMGARGLIDESAWLGAFLAFRAARLLRLAEQCDAVGQKTAAEALRISIFRVEALQALQQAGQWALEGELTIRGQKVTGLPPFLPPFDLEPFAAQYVKHSFSRDLVAIPAGTPFTATWWIQNTGTQTWDSAMSIVHLAEFGPLLAERAGFTLAEVGDRVNVAPGEQVAIALSLIAPATRGQSISRWQLQAPNGTRFGPRVFASLDVVPVPGLGSSLSCDARLQEATTTPDSRTFFAGQGFTQHWRILNAGQRRWGPGFRLVYVGGDGPLTGALSHPVPDTPPNTEVTLSVSVVAPVQPRTEKYISQWRLQDETGQFFGGILSIEAFVVPPAAQPQPINPFSQKDARWSGEKLGFGQRTIGEWGCLLTCMSMALSQFGEAYTPEMLNERLKQLPVGQGFVGDSVLFAALPNAFPHIELGDNLAPSLNTGARFVTRVEEDLTGPIDAHLAAGGAVILQVDTHATTAYNPDAEQHWVLAVARNGVDYEILDPLNGNRISLVAQYGGSTGTPLERLVGAVKSALFYASKWIRPIPPRLSAGMNINPDDAISNPLASGQLKGLDWVRFPFKAADKQRTVAASFAEYDPVVHGYAAQGLRSLIVLNQQTVAGDNAPWLGGSWEDYAARFAAAARTIAEHYAGLGDQVAYEIWNEGDNPATPWVSIFVPPDKFALILQQAAAAVRAVAPQARIILGGLSTGPHQARDYVLQCRAAAGGQLPVDAIGIHPYGRWGRQRPFDGWGFGELREQFDLFRVTFPTIPLWITEIGIANDQPLPDQYNPNIAGYLRDVFADIARAHARTVPVVIWFAWSDRMHNAGIVRGDGQTKSQVYEAFLSVRDRTLPELA